MTETVSFLDHLRETLAAIEAEGLTKRERLTPESLATASRLRPRALRASRRLAANRS